MKKTFITLLVVAVATATYAQGLRNNGAHIVVAGSTYLIVDGSTGHVTTTDGVIDLTGKLKLGGDFTNNVTGSNAFGTLATGSEVIFAGTGLQTVGGSSTAVFSFDKLTVNSGSTTQVSAGSKLLCNGAIVNNGTFTLKTNSNNATATLLDGGFSGAGINKVELYLNTGRNWYVSSPVASATSAVFNTNASYPMYVYSESTTNTAPWTSIINDQTSLTGLTGYISNIQTTGVYTFSGGQINTGNKSITLYRTAGQAKEGFNLVGNPYPSYVDLHAATRTNLSSSYWYRSKNSGNTAYVFDTYNLTSELGTSLSGKSMTNFIAPMQAFWVRVADGQSSGSIAFTNAMRSHQDESNNKFRAPAASTTTPSVLRLLVSNGTNADETIVLFNSKASNQFDAYDSPKMSNGEAAIPEIYTLAGTEQLTINGLTNIETNNVIPLGFRTSQANTFSIKATEISNFASDTQLILKDNLLNKEQELTPLTAYSFTSDIVNTANRFSLIFKSAAATTALNNNLLDEKIEIYKNSNRQIVLKWNGTVSGKNTAKVYTVLGKELVVKQITSNITVMGSNFIQGVYMVTVTSEGKNRTCKVIID